MTDQSTMTMTMTMTMMIAATNAIDCLVSLFQREDMLWQCNINGRVNRLFFTCHVDNGPEEALREALDLMYRKILREGPPRALVSKTESLDIDSLLEGL